MPLGPLPDPLFGNVVGSFAEDTVRRRLREQVMRVVKDNQFSAEINLDLKTFYHALPNESIEPLEDRRDRWDELGAPYFGLNWLDAPWLFAEIFFYRKLLEITQFFDNDVDIFQLQKRQAWRAEEAEIEALTATLTQTLHEPWQTQLPKWVSQALWGNQADLGLFPIGTVRPETDSAARAKSTLADDTNALIEYVQANGSFSRIDLILDNSGLEFIGDMCLADFLLSNKLVETVVLHAKRQPFFISDVMPRDIDFTLQQLLAHPNADSAASGKRWQDHLDQGRMEIRTETHWVDGLSHWEMDDALYEDLEQSALLISKGDLNYRRWIGDLEWNYDTPFADVVRYTPAPLLCLRTCKAPVACGISAEKTTRLDKLEPDWNTSGRYGLIQFHNPRAI